jgi:flagellar hook protein FlgE
LKLETRSADGSNMSASAISIQGLEQANDQVNAVAEAIATSGTSSNNTDPSVADLSGDIVSLTSAQVSYEANLAALSTSDQMEQSLIDITA